MKEWLGIITAVIQLYTATILYRIATRDKNKKGTNRKRTTRKRK